jgi:hypothetical protein
MRSLVQAPRTTGVPGAALNLVRVMSSGWSSKIGTCECERRYSFLVMVER